MDVVRPRRYLPPPSVHCSRPRGLAPSPSVATPPRTPNGEPARATALPCTQTTVNPSAGYKSPPLPSITTTPHHCTLPSHSTLTTAPPGEPTPHRSHCLGQGASAPIDGDRAKADHGRAIATPILPFLHDISPPLTTALTHRFSLCPMARSDAVGSPESGHGRGRGAARRRHTGLP